MPFFASLRRLCAAALLLVNTASLHSAEIRFNRDVRPILSTSCNKCHGPDDAHRKADLRLDTEEGIRRAFAGGIKRSEGWNRIISDDPDTVMPPPDAHVELKPRDQEILRAWVNSGAAYEGHWSFTAPRLPGVPGDLNDNGWVRNPIDAFVYRRLAEQGLKPNSDTDRARLLRRVTLDLTGLPPTIEELDAFLADKSDNAFEKVVDRLLGSPHFGERMAVVWMDAARYGDTSVFHADGPRNMWPWRDWVIRAYNENMPFDQFTVEQLAGDLLPDSTRQQKIATGFLRNNATTDEGGLIEEEYRVEYVVDRVKTTSMVWMGLSMECAQCHNHKYDPITQQEYYSFFAYFNQAADPGKQTRNGNQAPVIDVLDAANIARADQLQKELTEIDPKLEVRSAAAEADYQKWLAEASATAGDVPLIPTDTVLHLGLDEGNGRSIRDSSAAGRTGRLQGPRNGRTGTVVRRFRPMVETSSTLVTLQTSMAVTASPTVRGSDRTPRFPVPSSHV